MGAVKVETLCLSVGKSAKALDTSVGTIRRLLDRGVLVGPRRFDERAHRRVYVQSLRDYVAGDPVLQKRLESVVNGA